MDSQKLEQMPMATENSKQNCSNSTEKIIKLQSSKDNSNIESSIIKAKQSLLGGNLIALPTDTIYGIACLVQCQSSVEQLYSVKGRQKTKPIAICVGDIDQVKRWGKVTICDELLHELLPGPVTLVFERSKELNPAFNSWTHLIGIRIPDHDFVQQLAKACNEPIALTSANKSATKSSLQIEEFSDIWESLELIFDGGILGITENSRSGSTVIDLSHTGSFSIIRQGSNYQNIIILLRDKYKLEFLMDGK